MNEPVQTLKAADSEALSLCQQNALVALKGHENIFLTGSAGTGKSFLLQTFLRDTSGEKFPVLASTGAAAILIGGRTFHSFFGLGIMEGGLQATLERALKNKLVLKRIKKIQGIILDEVSMIPGEAFNAAESIARLGRGKGLPWGGLKIIAVGDFAQLPPVSRNPGFRDWAFLSEAWRKSNFKKSVLREIMRTTDQAFASILADVRVGNLSPQVERFLNRRMILDSDTGYSGALLFSRKFEVDKINKQKLDELSGPVKSFETEYVGPEPSVRSLKVNAPIPEKIELKKKALVMIRQNDPRGRWVNGSLGHVQDINSQEIGIQLLDKSFVEVPRTRFSLHDAEGNEIAAATNFPIHLAYAVTIHKAQGATLDKAIVDLRNLWEPGQAYVAMSRVRRPEDLWVAGWTPQSFKADPLVLELNGDMALVNSAVDVESEW